MPHQGKSRAYASTPAHPKPESKRGGMREVKRDVARAADQTKRVPRPRKPK